MNKTLALTLAGLTLFGSMLTTTALAAPPKGKKPPKKGVKKENTKALIAAGKKLYESNGCTACHAIGGKGGATGPDLTKVAADTKHNAKWMEQSIVDPKADNEESTMPSYKETIKGKDLKALIAYMMTLKK